MMPKGKIWLNKESQEGLVYSGKTAKGVSKVKVVRVRAKIRAAVLVPIKVATRVTRAKIKAIQVRIKAAILVITRVVGQRKTKALVQVKTVRAKNRVAAQAKVKAAT